MDCDTAREALSARIDGEREPVPAGRADEHLAGCESCRAWQVAAVEQTQLLNESTAWSAALGVAMLVAALSPVMAGGLTWVLAAFAGFLLIYEVVDTDEGRVSFDRPLTHLPVVVGAVLALLVWRRDRGTDGHQPDHTAAIVSDGIALPENASRGRRRGHMRSADGSAA